MNCLGFIHPFLFPCFKLFARIIKYKRELVSNLNTDIAMLPGLNQLVSKAKTLIQHSMASHALQAAAITEDKVVKDHVGHKNINQNSIPLI